MPSLFAMLANGPELTPNAIYVAGGLVTLMIVAYYGVGLLVHVKELRARPEKPLKQPLVVTTPPVYAPVTMVETVDRELRGTIDKLEKYVHESVHTSAKSMQQMTTLLEESNVAHREAIADVNKQGEARITKVHDRLNVMDHSLGGVEAQLELISGILTRMQQTQENLLGRTAPRSRGGAQ